MTRVNNEGDEVLTIVDWLILVAAFAIIVGGHVGFGVA